MCNAFPSLLETLTWTASFTGPQADALWDTNQVTPFLLEHVLVLSGGGFNPDHGEFLTTYRSGEIPIEWDTCLVMIRPIQ
jgi:hypothetical protein